MVKKSTSKAKTEEKAIVFIDGNNLYHNVKSSSMKPSHIDLYKLSQLVCHHFNCVHKKSIYYNSIPSLADGEKMYYEHMKYISSVKNLPKFEVKTRKLQRSSTKELLEKRKEIIDSLILCDKCKPIVEANCFDCIGPIKKREKGIDIMIAIDMLDLSIIKNKCDCCILISGDADFVPALNLVKENGKNVFSAFLPRGYSYELRDKHKFFILSRNLLLEKCLKK